MTLDDTLPTAAAAKAQAKRLRAHFQAAGRPLSHAEALEAVAALHGRRDWNTFSAAAPESPPAAEPDHPRPPLPAVGSPVRGVYLKRPFTARVMEVKALPGGLYRLGVRFDTPIDVVDSALFSAFRRNVTVLVTADGVSCDAGGRPTQVLRLTP
ncbi:glyoxalase superfamily protein [Caenispirillum bisanense]|uniref:Glyoxalase-related protein domain-containing protein n=1 Tax=Caenispirillum bisanense TaxID=414052 RepID=A0A286GYG2_9PROT|nr:glyoxalase superfamily protein [Caenispirillum bisanense]SOE00577.1 hypothetical protein SAMN05421508_11345 [Caenispirillum bisanense]